MNKRNIIVIGASAGGFEAIKTLVNDLPPNLDVSVFIVWHIAPDVEGMLPQVLNKLNGIPASHPIDLEPIVSNRVYVAPPDRHLLIEGTRIRITRGPKENRFRPAVDPLFRSAAYTYGSRVIGVILSGALDDGTAGLWTIKHRGGLAIVQDPADAQVSSMPENALRQVNVDCRLPISEMGRYLAQASQVPVDEQIPLDMNENEKTKIEVNIAMQDEALQTGMMRFGELSPFTCPDCHGVLTALKDGDLIRYRCHTGHAFSPDTLLATITEKIEDSLWSVIRGVDESIMLLNHLGDHFAESNHPKVAAMYFKKAKEAERRVQLVRQAVLNHEQLNNQLLMKQSEMTTENK